MRLPSILPKKKKSEDEVEFQEFDEPIQVKIAQTNPEMIPDMDFIPEDKSNLLEDVDPLETTALQRLKEHIASRPKREDYKAGAGRQILSGLAAALAGASGMNPAQASEFGRSSRDRKYNRAVEDYQMDTGKLKDLATIEERSNAAKEGRALRKDTAAEQARQREEDRKSREATFGASLEERKRAELERDKDRDAGRSQTKAIADLASSNRADKTKTRREEIIAKDEDDIRKEYDALTKEHKKSRQAVSKVRELSKQKGSVGELSQLMSLISSIDQTAAREGEVNTQLAARSWAEKIQLWKTRLGESAAVTPQMRKEIESAAEAMNNAMSEDRKLIQKGYVDIAKRRGYDIRNIVTDLEEDSPDDDAAVDAWLKANGLK